MENTIVALAQQRMSIMSSYEDFKHEAGRFLHQARAKAAQLIVFPELTGLMLAPPLISGLKLEFIKRADQGSQPTAGSVRRSLGRVSSAAAGVLGGGFRGSLDRLVTKRSDDLLDAYLDTMGSLAREYGMAIVGGTLPVRDAETDALKHRAYLFDPSGEVVGYQDKLNLSPDEEATATPGTDLTVLETRFGRIGLLIGRDVLYPELARVLALQGAELLIGIAASPGAAQARMLRSALQMRAEENQVFAAISFLLGQNYVGRENQDDYFGQSALFAPISLTKKGDGVLVQAGTDRTETLIATELDADALHDLWLSSGFRPRAKMNLGSLGPVLAEFYESDQTIEEVVEQSIRETAEPALGWEPLVAEEAEEEISMPPEPVAEEAEALPPPPVEEPEEGETEDAGISVAEAMSLSESPWEEDESAE